MPSNKVLKLLFQPAEEGAMFENKVMGGAENIIKEGFLKNCDEIYGMHNVPLAKIN